MVSDSESNSSAPKHSSEEQSAGWLKVGILAVASAIAGGLAAAWWYRKTLKTLRQTGETDQDPNFGIPPDEDF